MAPCNYSLIAACSVLSSIQKTPRTLEKKGLKGACGIRNGVEAFERLNKGGVPIISHQHFSRFFIFFYQSKIQTQTIICLLNRLDLQEEEEEEEEEGGGAEEEEEEKVGWGNEEKDFGRKKRKKMLSTKLHFNVLHVSYISWTSSAVNGQ